MPIAPKELQFSGNLFSARMRVAEVHERTDHRRAKPTRDALVEALRASPVVYADETGWKQGGRRVWLWVFTNLRETVYEILPGRGFEQAASVLGKNYAGTLGVDGWAPYRCFKRIS